MTVGSDRLMRLNCNADYLNHQTGESALRYNFVTHNFPSCLSSTNYNTTTECVLTVLQFSMSIMSTLHCRLRLCRPMWMLLKLLWNPTPITVSNA